MTTSTTLPSRAPSATAAGAAPPETTPTPAATRATTPVSASNLSGGNFEIRRVVNLKNKIHRSNLEVRFIELYFFAEDEYSHLGLVLTEEEWAEKDRRFERQMRKKGFVIKYMEEDGSCLFRAVADQVSKILFYLRRLARRSISAPDSDFGGEGGVYTEFRSLRSHFGQRMDFLVSIVNI